MGNYKFIISGIIFAVFIGIVLFDAGYKNGSQNDLSHAAEKPHHQWLIYLSAAEELMQPEMQ